MTDHALTDYEVDAQLSPRARLEILLAILLALFLFALDQTVVGVALPVIVTDLNGGELYIWSVSIYLLTSTISGPIYGKLSDLFGRRPIIIFAVSLFLFGSVLAGISQEMWQFIAARGIQGLGGGAIFPVALAVVADLYTPAERGKYLGLFGAVFGLSSLIGPAIGGIITDNFSWHWIFFVNVPLGLISLFILWRLLPAIRHPDAARHIDYLGAAVFTLAIAPFLIGLTNKGSTHLVNGVPVANDWTDFAVGGLILIGVLFGLLFIWIESRAADPIVPLNLFRIRIFQHLGRGDVPGRVRLLRGDHLPAPLVPDGRRRKRDGIRVRPPAPARRVDLQRDRIGSDRGENGQVQDPHVRVAGHAGRRPLPDDQPSRGHAAAPALVLDGHRRSRNRAVVRGLHPDRPERGQTGADRRRRPAASRSSSRSAGRWA